MKEKKLFIACLKNIVHINAAYSIMVLLVLFMWNYRQVNDFKINVSISLLYSWYYLSPPPSMVEICYLSIVFFYGEPFVGDEDPLLVCLHITDDHVVKVPACKVTFPWVVVPHPGVVQIAKRSGPEPENIVKEFKKNPTHSSSSNSFFLYVCSCLCAIVQLCMCVCVFVCTNAICQMILQMTYMMYEIFTEQRKTQFRQH